MNNPFSGFLIPLGLLQLCNPFVEWNERLKQSLEVHLMNFNAEK